jgi:hypothetical protein
MRIGVRFQVTGVRGARTEGRWRGTEVGIQI